MKRWFYLIVILQLLFLIAEAGTKQLEISRGQVVTLKVVPVDPRSLFMGHYMALDYDISNLNLAKIPHEGALAAYDKYDTKVYVELIPQKPWAVAKAIRLTPPPPEENKLYLQARVRYGFTPGDKSMLAVEYGLEQYFIPETKQEEVNRMQRNPRGKTPQITAEISVTKKGQGYIKRILVDGKPLAY
jgi:uncharacterized membrane-anchored protein